MRIEGKEIGVGNPPPTELFLLSEIVDTFLTVKLYVLRILMNTYNPINNWLYWLKQTKQNRTYVNILIICCFWSENESLFLKSVPNIPIYLLN